VLGPRLACNLVYAHLVRDLDEEHRAEFDHALMVDRALEQALARRVATL
jgi:hypothetical protein